MKKLLKWIAITIGGLFGLALAAVAIVWIWGGQISNRSFVPENRVFMSADGNVDIAEGERLARVLGCMNGCHGKELEGMVLFEDPMFGRMIAPNLTQAAQRYSDQELETIVRQGIVPDGRGLYVMPSPQFSAMRDQDLRNIISFIRQAPVSDNDPGTTSFGIMARLFFIRGKFKSAPEREMYEKTPERAGSNIFLEGDYLTRIKCSECHGRDLKGGNLGPAPTPSLVLAKAYSEEEFIKFLRTGNARGNREVGIMSEIARTHFAYLRDNELKDLFRFLQGQTYD